MKDKIEKTLRDEFAMVALREILSKDDGLKYGFDGCGNVLYQYCEISYNVADAMLDVRDNISFYKRNDINRRKNEGTESKTD